LDIPPNEILRAVGTGVIEASKAFRVIVSDDLEEDELAATAKQLIDLLECEDKLVIAAAAAALSSYGAYGFDVIWQDNADIVEQAMIGLAGASIRIGDKDVRRICARGARTIYYRANDSSSLTDTMWDNVMPKIEAACAATDDPVVEFDLDYIVQNWDGPELDQDKS